METDIETTEAIEIPEISNKNLSEMMGRVKFVKPVMFGLNGKAYFTDETDKSLFDLCYVDSSVNPRTSAFNFDKNQKLTGKASGIKEIARSDIFVKIGGYYGWCKVTMAEVMSQVPEDISDEVIAFALDYDESAQIINEDYQSKSIIWYGVGEDVACNLPSSVGLIKKIDFAKAKKFKKSIKPIIDYNTGPVFINPGNTLMPFLHYGIWIRINGGNLHKTNQISDVRFDFDEGYCISVYFEIEKDADYYTPSYNHVISQIPDELLTENVIGIMFAGVDFMKTAEGVLHQAKYRLCKKSWFHYLIWLSPCTWGLGDFLLY